MGKREYKLPDYGELNKEQDAVLALPKDGQFLIVGGPGTGKSVVALLRASNSRDENNYIYLTFNHVLNAATKQLVNFDLESEPSVSWFYTLYFCLSGDWMQQTEDYKPNYKYVSNFFEKSASEKFKNIEIKDSTKKQTRKKFYNWLLSLNGESLSDTFKNLHIIIDEGQDMPVGFYDSLQSLGCENYFVVADQNQQITDDNSTIKELADALDLDLDFELEEVIELKENFRQKKNIKIAELSQYFFTDKASPKPDLPQGDSLDTPILYEYELVNNCVEMILKEADSSPDKLIGLFVATETKREDYVKKLNNIDISRDYDKPIIETYKSADGRLNKTADIDFSHSGIVVLSDKSVKGIEFDIVYIILDGFKLIEGDQDSLKKRFYVMTSRAREKIVILKSKVHFDKIDTIFPDDESIIIRDTM